MKHTLASTSPSTIAAGAGPAGTSSYEEQRAQLDARVGVALGMGGEAKLAQRRASGHMNARERIDQLLDAGSFSETGQLAVSVVPADRDSSPADAKITGTGRIEGRRVAVVSNDMTVKGAS